jgi:serine phosphatase RsbU (regulator of sigma subunit)
VKENQQPECRQADGGVSIWTPCRAPAEARQIRFHAAWNVERLRSTCRVMGLFEAWHCETVEVELVPGNTLLLYTDGITEAANAEEFGESCLLDTLASHAHLPAGSVLQAVVGVVQQFSSASEQQDEITLVIARSLA